MGPPDTARFLSATPVLASLDIGRSVEFYRKLGFTALHAEQDGYGVITRDAIGASSTSSTRTGIW